jgi:COMPASS component SWD1
MLNFGRDMETMGVAMKLRGHWKQIQSLRYAWITIHSSFDIIDQRVTRPSSKSPFLTDISISWSRCGRYLLTASQDCRASLWDLSTQTRIRTAKFEAPIYTAELHPYNDSLFVVSLFEAAPFLVDITSPIATTHRLPSTPLTDSDTPLPATEAKQATTSAIFSTNGAHIITGTSKGYINIIETTTLRTIHSSKLSTGLFSLLRLTSNGRQLLANSTDRIIRVINMPDLSLLRPTTSTSPQDPDPDSPALDPSTLYLSVEHKFQDLVNRLRWNHASISPSPTSSLTPDPSNPTTSFAASDYVVATTYMKRDIYIWELRTNSLLRILENREEPAIIEWHPSRPLLACTSIETGSIQIWGIEPQQKWSALAPDFTEVTENVDYIEREDEFDVYPEAEHQKRRLDREDEVIDILTMDRKVEEETFVLPVLLDIEDSEEDDQELVRMGVGTMRKREVNEGKAFETDKDEMATMAANASSNNEGVKGKRRK